MERTRTFIALPIGPESRKAIGRLIQELRADSTGVSWVAEQNLHLTIAFLGDVNNSEIPEICRAMHRVGERLAPYEMWVHGAGMFGNPARPRTFWIGIEKGARETVALHQAVETELEPFGYRRENRPFEPHVTIGRVQRGGRVRGPLVQKLATLTGWDGGITPITEIQVMGSQLARGGPTYTLLGRGVLSAGEESRAEQET